MTGLPLDLRVATASDHQDIIGLIDSAAQWLSSIGSDQWAEPWPDRQARDGRVLDDLVKDKTWLAVDGEKIAATITIDPVDNGVWPVERRQESAVYLRRLVVDRNYGGLQVGARMLDWASTVAVHEYQAEWIRIDVWTTNHGLHNYYQGQGFVWAGLRDLADEPDYPSRALFQRSTALARPDHRDVIRLGQRPGWW